MFAKVYDACVGKEIEVYCHPYLYAKWIKLQEKIIKKNSDRVYTVVGMERSGKSSWTFQQAKVIDKDFGVHRICFTPKQFLDTLKNTPAGGVVVFDEAFRGFSSISSQSKVNKSLVQAMMEVGKRNLIIFIILPSFNYLTPYIATHRSQGLFQIYEQSHKNYRAWKFFSRKKQPKIYYLGKRNFGIFPVMKTKHKGKFFVRKIAQKDGKVVGYPYETFDLAAYEAKKDEAFNESPDKAEEKIDWRTRCIELRASLKKIKPPIMNLKQLAEQIGMDYRKFIEMRAEAAREVRDWNKLSSFGEEQALEPEEEVEEDTFDADNAGKSAEKS